MHQALIPPFPLLFSFISMWNIKLGHAGLLTLLIVGNGGREGGDGRAEKVDKSTCQRGFVGRSHHSKSLPRGLQAELCQVVRCAFLR